MFPMEHLYSSGPFALSKILEQTVKNTTRFGEQQGNTHFAFLILPVGPKKSFKELKVPFQAWLKANQACTATERGDPALPATSCAGTSCLWPLLLGFNQIPRAMSEGDVKRTQPSSEAERDGPFSSTQPHPL